jgi:hypothetical protein
MFVQTRMNGWMVPRYRYHVLCETSGVEVVKVCAHGEVEEDAPRHRHAVL